MRTTQDYDTIGLGYADLRRPDARVAARIARHLSPCRDVVNVGAGAGSYEPADTTTAAVEPSAVMIAQRPASLAPAVQARAERWPFADRCFDGALAVLTLHHWSDWRAGARELRRVARERVVVMTWDPACESYWLYRDWFPDLLELDRALFPPVDELAEELGGARSIPLPIPSDCTDGFLGAYWRRPAAYVDARVRSAMSSFLRLDDVDARITRLAADLASGGWQRRNAAILERDELDVGYRFLVADRAVR